MIIITGILITAGFIIFSAVVDAQHLSKKQYIESHISRACLRASFFIMTGIYNPAHGLASALLFAALFDQILNVLMGKKLFYLGTVAKWDRFFNKRKCLYIIVKVTCLVLSLILFIS